MQAPDGRGSRIDEVELQVGRAQGAGLAWAVFSLQPLRDDEGRVRGLPCTMQGLGPLVAGWCPTANNERS